MQETFSLNDLYIRYTDGLIEKKQFEAMIFIVIDKDLHRFKLNRWRKEDVDDYLSWLYPRISRAIDSYKDIGSSFEAYIGALVRFAAKEYRSRQADNNVAEYAAWTAHAPECYTGEEEPDYTNDDTACPKTQTEPPVKNPRQLLALVLKCYSYVSDDLLNRLYPRLGIEKEQLQQLINRLRELRAGRDRKIERLRESVNCQFYRCIVYEKRLLSMPENSALAERMKQRLEKARIRLAAMRKRLSKMRPSASNAQVAELLGVTKGSIDATLHVLKNRWNNDLNKTILN